MLVRLAAIVAILALTTPPAAAFIIPDVSTTYTRSPANAFTYTQFSAMPPPLPDGLLVTVTSVSPAAACAPATLAATSGLADNAVYVTAGVVACGLDQAAANLAAVSVRAVLFGPSASGAGATDETRAIVGATTFAAFNIPVLVLHSETYVANRLTTTGPFAIRLFQELLRPSQRQALAELYYDCNGAGWGFTRSVNGVPWLVGDATSDPCAANWERVICSPEGGVDQLLLDSFGLIGALPEELNALTEITRFDIQDNKVFGTLPVLDGWALIEYFLIAQNSISGSGLPPSWASLSSLEVIDLSANLFSGDLATYTVPTSLEIFRISGNSITGDLVPLSLPLLFEFSAAGNAITGTIPGAFFTSLPSLVTLDISANRLSGDVPGSLAALTSLQVINLRANGFTSLPSLAPLTALQELYVGLNSLTTIPPLGGNNALRIVDLSNNDLSGTIFSALPGSVESYSVAGNAYTSLGSALRTGFSSIARFDASDNKLSDLTSALAGIPLVAISIDLSGNELVHPYPQLFMSVFSQFVGLEELDLSDNPLNTQLVLTRGALPRLALLRTLDMSNTSLSGSISDVFGDLLALESFDFSSNPGLKRQVGPGPLVPSFAIANYGDVDTVSMANAACPSFHDSVRHRTVVMDASYHGYLLCTCLSEYYNTTDGRCEPCPSNAVCIGYPQSPLVSSIVPIKGYFPLTIAVTTPSPYAAVTARPSVPAARSVAQISATELGTANFTFDIPVVMKACEYAGMRAALDTNPCNPSSSTTNFSCALGHSGRLCGQCISGWFRRDGECIECADSAGLWPAIFLLSLLFLVCASALVAAMRPVVPVVDRVYRPMVLGRLIGPASRDTSSSLSSSSLAELEYAEYSDAAGEPDPELAKRKRRALIKFLQAVVAVTINYLQSISILLTDLSLPSAVLPLLSTVAVVRTTTSDSGVGIECIDSLESFHAQYRVMMLIPVGVVGVLILVFTAKYVWSGCGRKKLRQAAEARDAAESEQRGSEDGGPTDDAAGERYGSEPATAGDGVSASAATSSEYSSTQASSEYAPTSEAYSSALYSSASSSSSSSPGESASGSEQMEDVVDVARMFEDARKRPPAPPSSPLALLAYHYVYLTLLALNFFIFPIASFVFNVFRCEQDPVDREYYLVNYPHLECDEISWAEKVVPTFGYLVLPLVLQVVAMGLIEVKHGNYALNTTFGFWFDAFKGKYRYFALVFLLRRLVLALLSSFLPGTEIARHVLVLAILLVSALMVFQVTPFYHWHVNVLDVVFHADLVLIYAAGILVDDTSDESRIAIAAVTLIGCLVVAAVYLASIVGLAVWRVLGKGEWHDQKHRDAEVERVTKLHRLLEIGIHPVSAVHVVD